MQEINLHDARVSNLVVDVVSQLAAYTEEGVAMTPSVFICNSISDLLQRAGVGEHVPLSDNIPLEAAGPKILKAAAPLCKDNWRIYIERSDGETCRYGVFCGSSDPSSLTVDEVILDEFSPGFPIVRIAQSSTNKVEVRTNAGSGIEFRFNADIDVSELNSQSSIVNLARTIVRGLGLGPHDKMFSGFVERALSSAIKHSHGTLIAVVPAKNANLPDALQDMVLLRPHVDLYERFKSHLDEGRTAVSVSRLQAAAELISGFICSDGITVFNNKGCVLGYRAFIHKGAEASPSEGGARSRAYAAMCQLVGSDLDAAFFRSQDGRIEFHQRPEDF